MNGEPGTNSTPLSSPMRSPMQKVSFPLALGEEMIGWRVWGANLVWLVSDVSDYLVRFLSRTVFAALSHVIIVLLVSRTADAQDADQVEGSLENSDSFGLGMEDRNNSKRCKESSEKSSEDHDPGLYWWERLITAAGMKLITAAGMKLITAAGMKYDSYSNKKYQDRL